MAIGQRQGLAPMWGQSVNCQPISIAAAASPPISALSVRTSQWSFSFLDTDDWRDLFFSLLSGISVFRASCFNRRMCVRCPLDNVWVLSCLSWLPLCHLLILSTYQRGFASRRPISLPRTCEMQPSHRTVMRLYFATTKRTVARLNNDG